MRKSTISIVAVLVVTVVAFAAFGQAQRGSGRRPRMSQEERLGAIKAIESQLAKLKEAREISRPAGGYADMSEEERAKFRDQMMEVRQEQQKLFQTILAQVSRLQGRPAPEEEGVQYVIVNTVDLKAMQESASKEQATETAQLIERLIARASGQGRFRGGQRGTGQ